MSDLALILICAGIMTLLFKSLKQPIVLGYIVAGFLASPKMPYMPSVSDMHGIHLWSDIGVVFIAYIIGNTLPMIGMYGIFAVIAVAFLIFISPNLEKQSDIMTKTFTDNLNKRS